jgi:hypothetical protein
MWPWNMSRCREERSLSPWTAPIMRSTWRLQMGATQFRSNFVLICPWEQSWFANGKVVAGKVEAHPQQTEASIDVDVPHGTSSLQITFEGGFTLIPENSPPLLGEPSIAPHVVGIHLDQGHFTIDVDVPTGRTSHLQIESDWRMANAIGASMSKVAPNRTDFEFAADPANIASYRRAHLVIDVAR